MITDDRSQKKACMKRAFSTLEMLPLQQFTDKPFVSNHPHEQSLNTTFLRSQKAQHRISVKAFSLINFSKQNVWGLFSRSNVPWGSKVLLPTLVSTLVMGLVFQLGYAFLMCIPGMAPFLGPHVLSTETVVASFSF
jgi:hypothetical protein